MFDDLTNALAGLHGFIEQNAISIKFERKEANKNYKFIEKWHAGGNVYTDGLEVDFFYIELNVFYQNNGARGLDAIGYVGSLKSGQNSEALLELLKMNTLPLPISIGLNRNIVILRLSIDADFKFESQYYQKMLEKFLSQYKILKSYAVQKGWLSPLTELIEL